MDHDPLDDYLSWMLAFAVVFGGAALILSFIGYLVVWSFYSWGWLSGLFFWAALTIPLAILTGNWLKQD